MSDSRAPSHPLLALARLLRLQNVLTAAADPLAGYGWTGTWDWGDAGVAAGAGACLYAGGCVLNDLCDLRRDRTLHPERPLPSGAVPPAAALGLAAALLAGGVLLALSIGPRPAAFAAEIAIFVVAYDAFLKKWRVPGAAAMALNRGLNFGLGMAAGGALFQDPRSATAPCALAAFVFCLTLLSTFEEGCRPRAAMGALVVLGALALAAPAAVVRMPTRAAGPAALAAAAFLLVGLQSGRRDPERFLPLVIRTGVRCILPFEAAVLLGSLGDPLPGLVVLAFLAPTVAIGAILKGS
jgi:4-hydroxybenzoate polyprenyltransferase